MTLKIKNVELKSNVILAPMAGFSDFAMRKMCHDFGAGLTCTEMVSSKALHYGNKKTEELLISLDGESPKAVQIFGHEPEIMAEAVKNPLLEKFDIIDINMGCPARKIVSNGDGAALLKDISLAEKIIRACVNATEKPITVKFRIGFDENCICGIQFAKMCERAGASAITVHGRLASQGYSGNVDYELLKQIKNSVSIPVFVNGDIKTFDDKVKVLNFTGADGVMIGRASLGEPEKFFEMLTGKKKEVDKLEQIKFHYSELLKFFQEKYVVKFMRSHLAFYLSGKYKNSKALVELLKIENISEIFEKLDKLFSKKSEI